MPRRQLHTRNMPEGVRRATRQGVPTNMKSAKFQKTGERSTGTVPPAVRKILGR